MTVSKKRAIEVRLTKEKGSFIFYDGICRADIMESVIFFKQHRQEFENSDKKFC